MAADRVSAAAPLGGATLVAFAPTADLRRSNAFYADVLGLELVESSSFANVYDARGTTLRVTLVERPAAAQYTVLGWRVGNIAAAIATLTARGVTFNRYEAIEQDEDGVWTTPDGSRVAWLDDPDGNTLSLPPGGSADGAQSRS